MLISYIFTERAQSRRDETLLTVEFILRNMDAVSPLSPAGTTLWRDGCVVPKGLLTNFAYADRVRQIEDKIHIYSAINEFL